MEEYLAGPSYEDEPPEEAVFVWNAFLQLNARRPVAAGMGGVVLSPITFESLSEWGRANGYHLSPWEISAISRVDDLFLADQQRRAAAAKPPPQHKR